MERNHAPMDWYLSSYWLEGRKDLPQHKEVLEPGSMKGLKHMLTCRNTLFSKGFIYFMCVLACTYECVHACLAPTEAR